MVQNTLKQHARSFMEKHDVSYSTALRAVNEPLHELRNFSQLPDGEFTLLHPHFRLVGEESIYSSAFPELDSDNPDRSYREVAKAAGLYQFGSPRELIREMARRIELLEESGAQNIWEQRKLSRGGILGGISELQPIFHHYGPALQLGLEAMIFEGPELGIYAVNLARYIDIQERFTVLPVTLDQLSALAEGSPAGELSLPLTSTTRKDGPQKLSWSSEYALIASALDHSGRKVSRNGDSKALHILFREYPLDIHGAFEGLGLNSNDFVLEEPFEGPYDLTLEEDYLTLELDGETIYQGSSYGVLEYDSIEADRSVATAPALQEPTELNILEMAESIGVKFERNSDGTPVLDSDGWISTACPFHEDTDSFVLRPEQGRLGFFMCWKCGRNGVPQRLRLEWENPNIWDTGF